MRKTQLLKILVFIPFTVALGCQTTPDRKNRQGAIIDGAAGAEVAPPNQMLGGLTGGGFIIAAKIDKIKVNDQAAATLAARKSHENPATVNDARKAMTADLNLDGFVTLDEVVAMKKAGLPDEKMLDRMKATDQLFELTAEQQKYLADHGVSANVIEQMRQIKPQPPIAPH